MKISENLEKYAERFAVHFSHVNLHKLKRRARIHGTLNALTAFNYEILIHAAGESHCVHGVESIVRIGEVFIYRSLA